MSMFIQTIGQLNKRGTVNELDDTLARAVQQVRLTGKAAELTYKIKIKPQDADGERVTLEDSITLKTANPMRKSAIFFTSDDGMISRNDPHQAELPMESLDGGMKTVPTAMQPKAAVAQ